MIKAVSIALLAVGILLIVWGINSNNSFGSSVSRFFTGSPTNRTVWFLAGGIAASVLGLFGLIRGSSK